MKTKEFEQALPRVLKRFGVIGEKCFDGMLISCSPIVVDVPENFDFKGVMENSFKHSGIK